VLFRSINDGASCVLVTTAERGRDCKKTPVFISGMQGLPAGHAEFIWAYPGFGVVQQSTFDYKPELQPVYKMAGITPKDVHALFTYDAFSILAWMALERWGFCKPGEAAGFSQDGRIELGGKLPTKPNGGQLSEGHGITRSKSSGNYEVNADRGKSRMPRSSNGRTSTAIR